MEHASHCCKCESRASDESSISAATDIMHMMVEHSGSPLPEDVTTSASELLVAAFKRAKKSVDIDILPKMPT